MFKLDSYLQRRKEEVDRALEKRLPAADQHPQVLHEAIHYAVSAGGKRIRPILCLATTEVLGGRTEEAMAAALAVEIFHTSTLVHDDLPAMDDDDLRRGKQSTHIVFGVANAILAGDAMLILAFEWLAERPAPPPYSPNAYVLELARAAGHSGVIAGQVADLAAEGKPADAQTVEYIHRHKTGDLICAAVRLGAIAAGATEEQLAALTRYGQCTGLAFQIVDDILDETSTAEVLGKAPSDTKQGKATYVAVHGFEQARAEANQLIEQARSELDQIDADTEPLSELARYITARSH